MHPIEPYKKIAQRYAKTQAGYVLQYIYIPLPGAYAGFLRGGGPTLKFLGFWIYMSRAAKLRAFARGVWGHAPPPRIFFKMVQFRAF